MSYPSIIELNLSSVVVSDRCLNIHGTHVTANNSTTNNNNKFFFISDLKIVYYNNY